MTVNPANSLPGQGPSGLVDAFWRDPPGDGSLGTPDFSPVAYTYAPMLTTPPSSPQWVINQADFSNTVHRSATKGVASGEGVVRDARNTNMAFSVVVNPGAIVGMVAGGTGPLTQWAPSDFVIALGLPASPLTGTAFYSYLAFLSAPGTVGVQMSAGTSAAPWQTNPQDLAPQVLPVSLWDGAWHTLTVSAFGDSIWLLIDNAHILWFPRPQYTSGSTTTAWSPLSARYGLDAASTTFQLGSWTQLMPATGAVFGWQPTNSSHARLWNGPTTPAAMDSGEQVILAGSVVASTNGVTLGANSSFLFSPYSVPSTGILTTRWNSSTPSGCGLLLGYADANDYLILTSTALISVVGGVSTTLQTLGTPLSSGSSVAVFGTPTTVQILAAGQSYGTVATTQFGQGRQFGVKTSTTGTGTWGALLYQPMPAVIVLPTS